MRAVRRADERHRDVREQRVFVHMRYGFSSLQRRVRGERRHRELRLELHAVPRACTRRTRDVRRHSLRDRMRHGISRLWE